jgi:hypothetical protein
LWLRATFSAGVERRKKRSPFAVACSTDVQQRRETMNAKQIRNKLTANHNETLVRSAMTYNHNETLVRR